MKVSEKVFATVVDNVNYLHGVEVSGLLQLGYVTPLMRAVTSYESIAQFELLDVNVFIENTFEPVFCIYTTGLVYSVPGSETVDDAGPQMYKGIELEVFVVPPSALTVKVRGYDPALVVAKVNDLQGVDASGVPGHDGYVTALGSEVTS